MAVNKLSRVHLQEAQKGRGDVSRPPNRQPASGGASVWHCSISLPRLPNRARTIRWAGPISRDLVCILRPSTCPIFPKARRVLYCHAPPRASSSWGPTVSICLEGCRDVRRMYGVWKEYVCAAVSQSQRTPILGCGMEGIPLPQLAQLPTTTKTPCIPPCQPASLSTGVSDCMITGMAWQAWHPASWASIIIINICIISSPRRPIQLAATEKDRTGLEEEECASSRQPWLAGRWLLAAGWQSR